MTQATIYHNPRCSKSRQTLALLQEQGCDVTIVEYLKTAPDAVEIKQLMKQLGLADPREMMRTKEPEYKEQQLVSVAGDDLIAAMASTPKLIERPIVVVGDKAVFGRPPENVLALL